MIPSATFCFRGGELEGMNRRVQQPGGLAGKKRRAVVNRDDPGNQLNLRFERELVSSPLQGSFFTRNSSRAIQPPPTRTITVLRKIRTRRSCCESPNYGEERERVRHVDHHSRQERKKKRWCKYGDHTGLVELSRPCNSTTHTHTQILCVNSGIISFPCCTDLHKEV